MASSSIKCINLCDQTDCDWWHEQSVCLIESHGMKNIFLDVRLKSIKENGDSKKKADNTFVERKTSYALAILIYGSLCEDVLCTVFGIHKTKDVWEKLDANYIDTPRTTSYKLAGQMEPIHKLIVVSGAALQMQRELQWFEGVEIFEIMVFRREHKDLTNKDLVFAREHKDLKNKDLVFTRKHKDLRNKDLQNEGEKWMKTTDMLWLLMLDFFVMMMKTGKKFRV